jgi:hypothetical protein
MYFSIVDNDPLRDIANNLIKKGIPQKVGNFARSFYRTRIGGIGSYHKGLKNNKSLGPDGLLVEFYKTIWTVIGLDYLKMFQGIVRADKMEELINADLIIIKLISKGSKREMVGWRSIMLLNVFDKILAKSLASRVELLVSTIV